MKLIIAGSRTIKKYFLIESFVNQIIEENNFKITEVVSGACKGPDLLGENWAVKNGVPIKRFPANWESYGLSAGPIRNCKMVEYADILIAFWDGKSHGTKHIIEYAIEKNLQVFVKEIKHEVQQTDSVRSMGNRPK